jgi:hypothetical protein
MVSAPTFRHRRQSELPTEKVNRVRRLLDAGRRRIDIAADVGVSLPSIHRIRRGTHVAIRLGPYSGRCPGCGAAILTRSCMRCFPPHEPEK